MRLSQRLHLAATASLGVAVAAFALAASLGGCASTPAEREARRAALASTAVTAAAVASAFSPELATARATAHAAYCAASTPERRQATRDRYALGDAEIVCPTAASSPPAAELRGPLPAPIPAALANPPH